MGQASQHYAVLNKIDMLWDDLKSPEEIGRTTQRQIESTAAQLEIPTGSVLAISAQKALVGKIHGMQLLIRRMSAEFDHAHQQSAAIKQLLNAAYQRFHDEHGLKSVDPPLLDLTRYRGRLDELVVSTQEFCADPHEHHAREALQGEEVLHRPGHPGAHRLPAGAHGVGDLAASHPGPHRRPHPGTQGPARAPAGEHQHGARQPGLHPGAQARRSTGTWCRIKAQLDQIKAIVKEFVLLTGVAMRNLDG